ncbi:MAG: RNA polymerase sigma factor [Planctomycetales bacterium]|nr:RNA polymerase sigma factor [Planctomycetales bacterium]
MQSSDSTLLGRYRKGDDDAATALYVKYANRLRNVAVSQTSQNLAARFDADDVVQSVFRTFFRRASEGYFDVPPGDEIWSLFLVIALNKVRRLGKMHRRKRRDVGATESIESSNAESHESDALMTLQMSIDELLEALPSDKKQMIEMRIQGYGVTEIAEETDRCTRTVERTLRQFRESLAEQVYEE